MLTDREFSIGSYALRAAIGQDNKAAADALKKLGGEGNIFGIALAWVDSTLMYLTDSELDFVSLPPEWNYQAGRVFTQLAGTDDLKEFDDTEPDIQWSAKFLFARARNDRKAALDMWNGQTDEEYPLNFWALLMVCSANIKRAMDQGIKPRALPELAARGGNG